MKKKYRLETIPLFLDIPFTFTSSVFPREIAKITGVITDRADNVQLIYSSEGCFIYSFGDRIGY